MIGYRALLKKYMRHIIYAEGVDYIEPPYDYTVSFTEEEEAVLVKLSENLKGKI